MAHGFGGFSAWLPWFQGRNIMVEEHGGAKLIAARKIRETMPERKEGGVR